MDPDLMMICPSRGRPQKAWELNSAFERTHAGASRLIFAVDADDDTIDEYPPNVVDVHSTGMVAALNQVAMEAIEVYAPFAIGFLGDDHRPCTPGWDLAYLNALKELGTGICYGADLLQNEKMPTQVAMTADIPKALGYFCPPGFFHLCVDLCWKDWGEGIGRLKYLPDVVIEHLHPAANKAALDAGYERVNAPTVVARDSAEYERWKREDLPGEIEKLRRILK